MIDPAKIVPDITNDSCKKIENSVIDCWGRKAL